MTLDAPIEAISLAQASLRPLAPDDAEALLEIFSDPETMRHFGKPQETLAETRDMLAELDVEMPDNKWHRLWSIVPQDEPGGEIRCRGWVGLMNRIPDQDNAEFSIILHPARRGRGLARAAARGALGYGFGVWGLHRVYATVVPANGPSVRLLESLGFRLEGRLREAFHAADGYHDDLLYALLGREFETQGGAS
ncbi:MAG: GNAT family N-acetyltransferase [Rhodospirillales bacterium]|nr:GNAT family N-acetyltransferase [Rhodospirillales bacterium]